jgi:hypothetical protein
VLAVVGSWLINSLDDVTRWPRVDLFNSWVTPTLRAHEFGPESVLPGIVLSALSFVGGGLYAGLLPKESGELRRFEVKRLGLRLRFDPNPRVWSSFMQVPDTGQWFRVVLKSGKVVVGQISKYSTDPNDDLQEIVMEEYGVAPSERADLVESEDSEGILISREEIEYIEKLTETLVAEANDAANARSGQISEILGAAATPP